MLQPPQLQQVAQRYAGPIAELRDFLAQTGLPLDTPETLTHLATLLRDDRTFRRDLVSHIWVLLDDHHGHASYSDLLGILALAAAGQRLAATADETDAHHLLRFLMQARHAFDDSAAPAATPIRQPTDPTYLAPVVPIQSAPIRSEDTYLRRRSVPAEPDLFDATEPEQLTDNRARIAAAAVACMLVLLLLVLWFRYRAVTTPTTPPAAALATSAAAEPTATATTTAPTTTAPTTSNIATPAPAKSSRTTHHHTTAAPARRRTHPILLANPEPADTADDVRSRPINAREAEAQPISRRPSTPARYASNDAAPRTGISHPSTAPPTTSHVAITHDYNTPHSYNTPHNYNTPRDYNTANTPREGFVRSTSLGTMAANVLYSPAPAYPAMASAEHVQGEVRLVADVSPNGEVLSTRIISGPQQLRQAAADAVSRWHYRPYVDNGRPIGMNAEIVMNFQLPQ